MAVRRNQRRAIENWAIGSSRWGIPVGYVRERSAPVRLGRIIKLADTDGIGKKFFATDCTITMGDSGGPAFDLEGRVIGIHSFISTRIEENMHVFLCLPTVTGGIDC